MSLLSRRFQFKYLANSHYYHFIQGLIVLAGENCLEMSVLDQKLHKTTTSLFELPLVFGILKVTRVYCSSGVVIGMLFRFTAVGGC
jgi:hypothetical protein